MLTGEAAVIHSHYAHIVGYGKLHELLRPSHPYFENAAAQILNFQSYRDGDTILAYPKVVDPSRRNPYARHRTRQKHTQRTVSKIMRLKEAQRWTDLRFAVLVFTMPHQVSKWLSKRPADAPAAWRLFERWWRQDYASIVHQGDAQSVYVNLHKWSTRSPNTPHYHFHMIIPNKVFVQCTDATDEDDNPAYELKHVPYHKQRGGTEVPYSDLELASLKHAWTVRVAGLARRHRILTTREIEALACDVYVQFIDLRDPGNLPKLVHRINYQSRHWIEDYAVYTNDHPHADNPPPWLEHYDNRTRIYGWMQSLTTLAGPADPKDKAKLSPINARPMEYIGGLSLYALQNAPTGPLSGLDLARDGPLIYPLTPHDLDWLTRAIRPPSY